jgi:hypothetical protein
MSKLNGFENFLILEVLGRVKENMIAEIEKSEGLGKNPIMTSGFVEMTISDLILKMKLNK